jgi:hippurate hydrolase
MRLPLLLALAVMTLPTLAEAATLSDAIHGDMPELLTIYRDLHAHPELSMVEQRTPAVLAPMMRKLGFEVTGHVGSTGAVAVM